MLGPGLRGPPRTVVSVLGGGESGVGFRFKSTYNGLTQSGTPLPPRGIGGEARETD